MQAGQSQMRFSSLEKCIRQGFASVLKRLQPDVVGRSYKEKHTTAQVSFNRISALCQAPTPSRNKQSHAQMHFSRPEKCIRLSAPSKEHETAAIFRRQRKALELPEANVNTF